MRTFPMKGYLDPMRLCPMRICPMRVPLISERVSSFYFCPLSSLPFGFRSTSADIELKFAILITLWRHQNCRRSLRKTDRQNRLLLNSHITHKNHTSHTSNVTYSLQNMEHNFIKYIKRIYSRLFLAETFKHSRCDVTTSSRCRLSKNHWSHYDAMNIRSRRRYLIYFIKWTEHMSSCWNTVKMTNTTPINYIRLQQRWQVSVESAILSKLLRDWWNHAVAGPAVKTRTARPTDDMLMNCLYVRIRLMTVHGNC